MREGDRTAMPRQVHGAQAVAPPDHPDVHVGQVAWRHILDEPGQLARCPVVLAADRLHNRDLRGSHGGRDALHEQPEGVRVGPGAVPGLTRAHDVVAEHALYVGAGRFICAAI